MSYAESRHTSPLQQLVLVCSVVFVLGTAFQAFVIIDGQAMRSMMELAGRSPAEAAAEAPGFLTGFRVVGTLYLVLNAVGLLAPSGRAWVFWVVLLTNVTQAFGFVAIPPEVWRVTLDRFGPTGLLPTIVTDGGGALLSMVLVASLIRYRRPWAQVPMAVNT